MREELSSEDTLLLFAETKECCEQFGISKVIIQVRYEQGIIPDNPG